MKEFYVPTTEFENPDDPFLHVTSTLYEVLSQPEIFPLSIDLKAVLEFSKIPVRPKVSFAPTPMSTPYSVVLYQTEPWYDQVNVRLCAHGWSTFASRDEAFQESTTYQLCSDPTIYRYSFEYVGDHCALTPSSLKALPCGTKPTQDPAACVLWYCIPKFSNQHKTLVLSWESAFEYDDYVERPLAQAIAQGALQCELKSQQAKKRYRSHTYDLREGHLWITFVAIESSPVILEPLA